MRVDVTPAQRWRVWLAANGRNWSRDSYLAFSKTDVRHRLSGRRAVVDADGEAVRVQCLCQLGTHLCHQVSHSRLLGGPRSKTLATCLGGITRVWPCATG